MATHTLAKHQRLKKRKLIGKVFAEGKPVQSFPIRAVVLFTQEQNEVLQAGFSVSTRNFKKAVDRNRVKRLLKEVYRKKRPELEAGLIASKKQLSLFFIFTGKELPDYTLVEEKMHLVIKRILEQINGNAQKNS